MNCSRIRQIKNFACSSYALNSASFCLCLCLCNIIEIIIMCVLCATIKRKQQIYTNRLHMWLHEEHTVHTHTHMHTKKSSPYFTKGRTNLKRPQDFRVEKQKLPLTVVECWPPTLCVCVCVWGQLPSVSLPPLLLPPFTLHFWPGNLLFMQCLRVDGKYMQISWPYPAYLYAHLYSTFSFLCYPHRIGLNLCSYLPSKKLMGNSTISNLLSISQWHNNNNNKNKNNLCDWPQ